MTNIRTEKTLERQKNNLSTELLLVYKKNRNFIIVMPFVIDIIIGPFLLLFFKSEKLIIYVLLFPWVLSIFSYLVWYHIIRSLPHEILYLENGVILFSRRNKRTFLSWDDITNVKPLVAYGKIKVPDYMLFFKKPFPGYTPVSKEVAEKIMEYMEKYKNLKIEGGDV